MSFVQSYISTSHGDEVTHLVLLNKTTDVQGGTRSLRWGVNVKLQDYLTMLMRFDDSRTSFLCKLAVTIFGTKGVERASMLTGQTRNGKSLLHKFLIELMANTSAQSFDAQDVSDRGGETSVCSRLRTASSSSS